MNASGTGNGDINLAQAIAAELAQLRRNEGLTRFKLAQCRMLLNLPCVTREWQRHGAEHDPTAEERTIEAMRLLRTVLSQGKKVRYLAVRNAFAIDLQSDPGTLTQRRSRFAAEHQVSIDTVRDWETAGIHELSLHLIELGMNSETVTIPRPEPVNKSVPLTPPDGHEDYEIFIWSLDLMHRYENGRQLASRLEVLTVEALIDGVTGYAYQLWYSGGQERVSAENIDGCNVSISQRPWVELIVRVAFDRALARGERHRLIYRLNIRPGPSDPDPVVFTTVNRPTHMITLRARFSPDLIPHTVHTFSSLVRHDPEFRQPLETFTPLQGYVESSFPRPRLGRTYGLYWEWPD